MDSHTCGTISKTLYEFSLGVHVVDKLWHNGQPDIITLFEMTPSMTR